MILLTKAIKAWDRLSIARMIDRPNAEDYIKLIFDNFFELHNLIAVIGMFIIVNGVLIICKFKNNREKCL